MKIEFFHDREGTRDRICNSTNWINNNMKQTPQCSGRGEFSILSIRVDGELVWVKPKKMVRVHPERHHRIFHSEIEVEGISYDLYLEEDYTTDRAGPGVTFIMKSYGAPSSEIFPAIYEEEE